MDMYTRKKMLGRKVAIAGKSDRRTAASTGIGVPRDCVKNQKKPSIRRPVQQLSWFLPVICSF